MLETQTLEQLNQILNIYGKIQRLLFIVDPTARITGGETCGDYARIYDVQSFKRRILDHVGLEAFEVEIVEILIGGQL